MRVSEGKVQQVIVLVKPNDEFKMIIKAYSLNC